MIKNADEHTQAHKNLAYEVDILKQASAVLPELLVVVKNCEDNIVGFVAEFIYGADLKNLVERGMDRSEMRRLLYYSIENARSHALFFWDIRAENFIARRGEKGTELIFVDAGGILKNDPGLRLQESGIESTLNELYGQVH